VTRAGRRSYFDQERTDPPTGRIMLGDTPFRAVRAPLWDLDARIAVLDAHSVTLQVVSPTPIMLTYWAEPKAALDFARAVNDSLAAHVAASRGRLAGLGTVPLQDPALAERELRRLVTELGLAGSRSAPARPTENSTTPSWHRSSARRPSWTHPSLSTRWTGWQRDPARRAAL